MVLIFNLAAGAVLVASIGAAAIAHVTGSDPYWLIAAFATMTAIGGALELHPRASWHPRYFWIVPAWLVGLPGLGLALRDEVAPVPGTIALAASAAGFVALLVHAGVRKPGGRWLAGIVAAGAVVTGFQMIGYWRPEWKHPVLYVINAMAMITMIYCSVRLYRARHADVVETPKSQTSRVV